MEEKLIIPLGTWLDMGDTVMQVTDSVHPDSSLAGGLFTFKLNDKAACFECLSHSGDTLTGNFYKTSTPDEVIKTTITRETLNFLMGTKGL